MDKETKQPPKMQEITFKPEWACALFEMESYERSESVNWLLHKLIFREQIPVDNSASMVFASIVGPEIDRQVEAGEQK